MSQTINIAFPLTDSNINQLFAMTSTTKAAYLSDLLLLLYTNVGERYLDPSYGTQLLQYIFDPDDNLTQNNVIKGIKSAVKAYIPDLTIADVTFSESEQENQINCKLLINYNEEAFTDSTILNLTF